MPNIYQVGQTVRLSGVFKNAAGTLTDPTTVIVRYKSPAGTITTKTYPTDAEVVKDSTGNYHLDFPAPAGGHGEWPYGFEGTGALLAANISSFIVANSPFD